MANIDVTGRLERLEVFEERLGVTLASLSAFVDDVGDDNFYLAVRGELQPRRGTALQEDLELVIAVYDSNGRIIGTASDHFFAERFFGLETFELTVNLPLAKVSKIRVYPKKG